MSDLALKRALTPFQKPPFIERPPTRARGAFATVPPFRLGKQVSAASPPLVGKRKTPEVAFGRLGLFGDLSDQKPDLISSNSSIILARNSWLTGVCARRVVVTGSMKAAFCASSGIVAIAASLASE